MLAWLTFWSPKNCSNSSQNKAKIDGWINNLKSEKDCVLPLLESQWIG
jgi:hypothetical protein